MIGHQNQMGNHNQGQNGQNWPNPYWNQGSQPMQTQMPQQPGPPANWNMPVTQPQNNQPFLNTPVLNQDWMREIQARAQAQQAAQQSQEPQGIYCRLVHTPDEIKPIEISMNGNVSVFVQDDLSKLYLGRWGKEGKIDIDEYVLVQREKRENGEEKQNSSITFQDLMNDINSRLDKIEMLLSSSTNKQNYDKQNQKKEVDKNVK